MKRAFLLAIAIAFGLTACKAGEKPEPILESENITEPDVVSDKGEVTVYTDWSKLGEHSPAEAIGSRWYEEYTDYLIPCDGYGMLIPYAGQRLMDNWPSDSGCMYGLMTVDGTVVVDPVYSGVYRPWYYDGSTHTHELLVLSVGDSGVSEYAWNSAMYAVAAGDGSWCTDIEYRAYSSSKEGLLLFKENSMTVMSPEGQVQCMWTAKQMGISQEEFDDMLLSVMTGEGWGGERHGDYVAITLTTEQNYTVLRCFNIVTGEISKFNIDEWRESWTFGTQTTAVPGAERKRDKLLGDDAPCLLELRKNLWGKTTYTYYLEDGTPIPQLTRSGDNWYEQVSLTGGLIEVLELNTASYYDLTTLECRFRTYLNYDGE